MRASIVMAAAVVPALLVLGGWTVSSRVKNRLAVMNHSGQVVTFLTIELRGKAIRFDEVPAGASVSTQFHIHAEGHFEIRGRLTDGTEMAVDRGYVTGGMYGERVKIVIQPGGRLEVEHGPDPTLNPFVDWVFLIGS